MKILHLSTSDINGGAAKAAFAIHKALQANNINSKMLVQEKLSNDNYVESIINNSFQKASYYLRYLKDYLSIKFLTDESRGRFSFPFWGIDITKNKLALNSDILQMHWINQAFLSLENIQQILSLGKPIIWTLHDMWAFTGGCHYNMECLKFLEQCYECPSLKFSGKNDSSKKIFDKKKTLYEKANITIVTSSNWLAREVKRSALFKNKKVEVIPTPIDINLYKPIDKTTARQKLNIKADKILILFGTMTLAEKRKGFQYMKEALILLDTKFPGLKEKAELLVFGKVNEIEFKEIPFKTNSLGRLNGENNIALAYNAADLFVAPSLQDNLPNTVLESLSCGLPVAAFNIGGMPDMIDHKKNGFLAENISSEELSNAIYWILENEERRADLGKNARRKVMNNFTKEIVSEKYKNLYNYLLIST